MIAEIVLISLILIIILEHHKLNQNKDEQD